MAETRAARWMARVRDGALDEVVSFVIGATDADEARVAAFVLRGAGAAGVRALSRAAEAPDPGVRSAVLDALAGGPAEVLWAWAQREPAPWLARRAVQAALRLDPSGMRLAAAHPDPAWRGAAAGEVRRRSAWSEVAFNPHDPELEVAWTALVGLRRSGRPRPAITDRGPWLLAQSTRGAQVDAPDDLDAVRALNDRDPEQVRRAAAAMVTLDDELALLAAIGRLAASDLPDATAALVGATRHPLEVVRAAATRALDGRTGDEVWDAYRDRAAEAPDPEVRRAVVWTIGRRNEEAGLDLLVAWTGSPDLEEAAADALLARVRRTLRSRTPAVRAALERLVEAGGPGATRAREALSRF